MKIQKHNTGIKHEGFSRTYEFTIKSDKQAFDTLFRDLYAYPKKAIIRELSTNCFDTHSEIGKGDLPFEVHLPNAMNPSLSFRDFGTGILPDEMEAVYTKVFESTRSQSDEFAGKWGLGCKTPFSYTDNYIIESWKNGRYYIYSAFRNEEGVPSLGIIDERGKKSNEPTGTRITIPVKKQHFSEFYQLAKEVYQYFIVKPKILGYQIDIAEPEYIVELPGLSIRNSGSPMAVMGNIAYPINTYVLSCRAPLDIHFDIGELEITPSREALLYEDKTNKCLKEKNLEINKKLEDYLTSQVKDSTTYWDARVNSVKLNKKFGLSLQCTWNGETITSYQPSIYLGESFNLFTGYKTSTRYISIHNKLVIVENDENRGSHIKSLHYSGQNNKSVLLIPTDKLADVLSKSRYPEDRVIKVSTLVKPPKTTPARKIHKACKYIGKSSYYRSTPMTYWEDVDVDITKGKEYYVEVSRGSYGSTKQHPKHINGLLQSVKDQLPDIVVYGVKTRFIKQVGPKWIELTNEVKNLLNVDSMLDDYINYFLYQHIDETYRKIAPKIIPVLKDGIEKDLWSDIANIPKGKKYSLSLLESMGLSTNITTKLQEKKKKLRKTEERLMERYPLISWNHIKKSIQYITLLEKENKNVI